MLSNKPYQSHPILETQDALTAKLSVVWGRWPTHHSVSLLWEPPLLISWISLERIQSQRQEEDKIADLK